MEEIQDQAAPSRLYEVTREYKLFHGSDTQPTSEVTAQIDFAHPNIKPYKILQTSGASRGEEMVRELLERETDSSKAGRRSEIRRMNYDFVFLRQETVGVLPEYVLEIFPRRGDPNLLRGQIWVDASTRSVFAELQEYPPRVLPFGSRTFISLCSLRKWPECGYQVTFDAIATVRLFGEYTLAGRNTRSSEPPPLD